MLGEEEISDVSLGTFYVFDKEDAASELGKEYNLQEAADAAAAAADAAAADAVADAAAADVAAADAAAADTAAAGRLRPGRLRLLGRLRLRLLFVVGRLRPLLGSRAFHCVDADRHGRV